MKSKQFPLILDFLILKIDFIKNDLFKDIRNADRGKINCGRYLVQIPKLY